MASDTRGVTALQGHDQSPDPLELIFWQLMCDMEFDPAEPGPDVSEDPQPWDLDDAYPRSLVQMLEMLGGGDDGAGSVADADLGHGRVPGSEGGGSGASCVDAQWGHDVAAVAGVVGGGSAGSAELRADQSGAVDDQVEGDGVAVAAEPSGQLVIRG